MNGRRETDDDVHRRLQRLVDRATRPRHVHGLLVGVETDDRSISSHLSSGEAEPGDAYFIASVTKLFTAAIVMQLTDEGRLRLEDRVVDRLPHLDLAGLHRHRGVDATDRLELHHLLHQTSGLADYFVGGLQDDLVQGRDRRYDIDDVVEMARSRSAEFPLGDRDGRRSAYSDTNYQLLTAVIETTTGTSYARTVEDRIAGPLGLTETYVFTRPGPEGARPPLPLRHEDQTLSLPEALASERGAGGIVSTLSDQLRFLRAYHQSELFDPRHRAAMQRWNRIFFPIDYGYGVMRYRLPRWMTGWRPSPELIGHSGSTGSFAFSDPAARWHVVGSFNQMDKPSRPFRLLTRIADLMRRTLG